MVGARKSQLHGNTEPKADQTVGLFSNSFIFGDIYDTKSICTYSLSHYGSTAWFVIGHYTGTDQFSW